MKSRNIIYATLLLSLFVILQIQAMPALAQNTADMERAEQALKRTGEIIDEAQSAVSESRSNKARLRIEKAEAIQFKALESFQKRSYRLSLKLTMEARQEANQAMAIARLEMQTEARLGRIIEETIERIGRVRDIAIAGEIKAERPMKLIDEARNLIEKSRLNANQYRYQLAINLAENARQRAIQAEKEIRTIRGAKEMAMRRFALMERLIDRARERVRESGDERAERQLQLAERQLLSAQELLRDGKYRATRIAIEQCEKTLRNLIRRFRRQSLSDPAAALDEAYRLVERAEGLIERREGRSKNRSRERIEQAKRLLDRAEQEASRGNNEEAQRLIAEVRRRLQEAVATEQGAQGEDDVTLLVERVRAIRQETASFVEFCTAPGVETLLERADKHLDRATALLAEGGTDAAAAEARIARNMYNRIGEICSSL